MVFRPSTVHILAISFLIHIALLIYANHVDSNPHKFGGLKYTDVDWSVVSDGARLIFSHNEQHRAQGWLVQKLGWVIGDPYRRPTFRYTALLPILLSPTILHPFLGKFILVLISLLIPLLLRWDPRISNKDNLTRGRVAWQLTEDEQSEPAPFWPTHLLWTLNPFVLNITTRGSPEAIIVFLVVACQTCLRAARHTYLTTNAKSAGTDVVKYEVAAALLFAISISWKIYPIIYFASIWTSLKGRYGWFGWGTWRFGWVVALGLAMINGVQWLIWGQPFLDNTYLHHLSRLDHRHNFSPYFYPIYLGLFPAPSPTQSENLTTSIVKILRHPLTSFLPQTSVVLLAGFWLTPVTGPSYAMFVQTVGFVAFNKVCTSQYFMWFLPLLPPMIRQLPNMPLRRLYVLLGLWVISQAIWLGTAYRLEFLGASVHVELWIAGLGVFVSSIWALGEILDGYGRARTAASGDLNKLKTL